MEVWTPNRIWPLIVGRDGNRVHAGPAACLDDVAILLAGNALREIADRRIILPEFHPIGQAQAYLTR